MRYVELYTLSLMQHLNLFSFFLESLFKNYFLYWWTERKASNYLPTSLGCPPSFLLIYLMRGNTICVCVCEHILILDNVNNYYTIWWTCTGGGPSHRHAVPGALGSPPLPHDALWWGLGEDWTPRHQERRSGGWTFVSSTVARGVLPPVPLSLSPPSPTYRFLQVTFTYCIYNINII